MGTKYIENTGPDVMYVGGKMIQPGEGRDIDTDLLPAELQDPSTAPGVDSIPSLLDLVRELLAKNVKMITAELPGLTQEALDLLLEMEADAATPRTSLLGAIKSEHIKRAAATLEGAGTDGGLTAEEIAFQAKVHAAYQAQLDKLSPDELAAIGEDGHAALRHQAELDVKAEETEPPAA